eukprot:m.41267 g.41267  ORF g.41267 m.41267 type:complete len:710 (+) comp11444_c0_seq1:242-2371(+)
MASHEHAPSPGSSEADVAGAFPTVHAHESHADSHEDVQSDGSFDEVDMDEVHEIEDQAELEAISQDMSQGETGMPSLFSLRRPRDARAGLSSGLKSIGKGVAGGVAALFAAPIAGAASDGAKGFFKGVGAGLVGAVMLPVAGVAVGATQMVRGVVNTPEALTSSLAGKKWDESSRQWVEWDPRSAVVLDDDAHRPKSLLETLMAQLKEEEAARNAEGKDDADGEKSDGNEYYDILKVDREASQEVIRKQYFVLARQTHPDRNPDDPLAEQRFQELSKAYQVLSDPDLRARYDVSGADAVDDAPYVEPGVFFAMLFGSSKFEKFIGDLAVASVCSGSSELEIRRFQLKRTHTLATTLRHRLDSALEIGEEAFVTAAREEGASLADASFGRNILCLVGHIYVQSANEGAGGFSGFAAKMRGGTRAIRHQFTALRFAASAAAEQRRIEQIRCQQEEEEIIIRRVAEQARRESGADEHTDSKASESGNDDDNGQDGAAEAATGAATRAEEGSTASAETSANSGQDEAGTTKSAQETIPDDTQDSGAEEASGANASASAAAAEAEAEAQVVPAVLEALWAANVVDIESTLRQVCRLVLRGGPGDEPTVPKAVRQSRCQALRALGNVLIDASGMSLDQATDPSSLLGGTTSDGDGDGGGVADGAAAQGAATGDGDANPAQPDAAAAAAARSARARAQMEHAAQMAYIHKHGQTEA